MARHRLDRRDLRDRDRCDPRVVKPSLEQSDRLLADRSSRNQQHQVDAVAAETVDGDRDMARESSCGRPLTSLPDTGADEQTTSKHDRRAIFAWPARMRACI